MKFYGPHEIPIHTNCGPTNKMNGSRSLNLQSGTLVPPRRDLRGLSGRMRENFFLAIVGVY